MNILFLSKDYPPDLIGGVGIYVKEASQALSKAGHAVFVITASSDREIEYIDNGVRIFRVKAPRFSIFTPLRSKLKGFLERIEYSWTVSKKIKELTRLYGIDIVESCEARAEGFWYFLFHTRPKLVVKLHTPESIVFKLDHVEKTLDYRMIEYLEDWWIQRADRIIGLTDAIIGLTKKYFNIKKNGFPKIVNPIDLDRFVSTASIDNGSRKNVLYVGRLEFRKGIHILVKAIPKVIERHPDAMFIFVGSNCGMRDYILNKGKELGLLDNIELVGNIEREDLLGYYNSADCCVIPSLWENHPYVCLEAMACGRPIVASKVAGIPEIIRDGSTGLLVPPGSFNALAEGIIKLLEDKGLSGNLGRNARKYLEKEYALDNVVNRIVDLYEKVP